jgi:hypothetical protein
MLLPESPRAGKGVRAASRDSVGVCEDGVSGGVVLRFVGMVADAKAQLCLSAALLHRQNDAWAFCSVWLAVRMVVRGQASQQQ